MKDKIYRLLKQAYSKLGLADEFLQAQAEMLDKLGIVTEDNVDTVIEAQKSYLESLQKENDRRVTEAQKKFQAEQTAKEEAERKKAEEEAERKKAEEEARKAAEEAERKRLEDLAKQNEMPEYMKKFFDAQAEKDKERQAAFDKEREEYKRLLEEQGKTITRFAEQSKEQGETIKGLEKTLKAQQEAAEAKEKAEAKAKAIADHKAKILSKAKELGIPQSRIDEGFVIADDADDDTITNVLTKVSNNYKTLMQPQFGTGFHANLDDKATEKDIDDVASSLVDSL